MDRVAMYLRKSRADIEAEARGEGETLAKHKKALLKVASKQKLNIITIKQELVSGESLIHRPEMLQLLKEVENRKYNAVLVMDVDRLGRGNMQEQGMILETFRESDTKIITPRKTYDLRDEWDEEYSEFEAFMARKELKLINRRLQSGRVRSIEEGNYISPTPPFGYVIKELDNGRTLEPHPEQSAVVKMIFDLYTREHLGGNRIANELNKLGYKTFSGRDWASWSVLNILKNEVYIGNVVWKKKQIKKSVDPGKSKDTKLRERKDWIVAKGKHKPLVSIETFEAAQQILKGKYHVPYQIINGVSNPLAGIMICGKCGRKLSRRPYNTQKEHLICHNTLCDNRSTQLALVEIKLLESLHEWLIKYEENWDDVTLEQGEDDLILHAKQQALKNLFGQQEELTQQRSRLHDFLERGIYSEDVFLERSQQLADRLHEIEMKINATKKEIDYETKRIAAKQSIIPKVRHVLDTYSSLPSAAEKNRLLKTIVEKAIYIKERHQRKDNFELILYLRLPESNPRYDQREQKTDNM